MAHATGVSAEPTIPARQDAHCTRAGSVEINGPARCMIGAPAGSGDPGAWPVGRDHLDAPASLFHPREGRFQHSRQARGAGRRRSAASGEVGVFAEGARGRRIRQNCRCSKGRTQNATCHEFSNDVSLGGEWNRSVERKRRGEARHRAWCGRGPGVSQLVPRRPDRGIPLACFYAALGRGQPT